MARHGTNAEPGRRPTVAGTAARRVALAVALGGLGAGCAVPAFRPGPSPAVPAIDARAAAAIASASSGPDEGLPPLPPAPSQVDGGPRALSPPTQPAGTAAGRPSPLPGEAEPGGRARPAGPPAVAAADGPTPAPKPAIVSSPAPTGDVVAATASVQQDPAPPPDIPPPPTPGDPAPILEPAPVPLPLPGPPGPLLEKGGAPPADGFAMPVGPPGAPSCPTCGLPGRRGPDAVPQFDCGHCGPGGCIPGRGACYEVDAHTFVGRFFGNLYQCLCCPDPCYQPAWVAEANAAFFTDYARPRTITRIRYDHMSDLLTPDRAEFFWARSDGKGRGPQPPRARRYSGFQRKLVPIRGEQSFSSDELFLYQETAAGRASFFVEYGYLANYPRYTQHHSGFGDLNLGTKSLLFDCELMQVTFQFKTFLPTGQSAKGLGTGHVSLEPSLLTAIKISPTTYLQGQLSEWIPIGGDPLYAGSVIHYHLSLNQTLLHVTPNSPLIGTFEFQGYTFQAGAYTDPFLGPRRASGFTYFNMGPGLRMSVCDGVDFGAAVAFPTTDPHWANPLVRVEFRILF